MSIRNGKKHHNEDVIEVPEFAFDEQQMRQLLSTFRALIVILVWLASD